METLILILCIGILMFFLCRGRISRSNYANVDSDKYSTCRFLAAQGYTDTDIQRMCKKYTDACGDPSNTGFAYNVIQNTNPLDNPFDRSSAMQLMYENAVIDLPPNEGGYCKSPIGCPGPGKECPLGLKCQNFDAPFGQQSPACF